jgi:hypothetical protein
MRIRRRFTRTVLSALISLGFGLVAIPSFAWVDCTGTVTNLSLHFDMQGTVILGLSGGPSATYVCAVDNVMNDVSPTVCRTMYASLMAAKLANKRVLIRFDDHSTCTSVPNWAPAGQLSWTQLLLD